MLFSHRKRPKAARNLRQLKKPKIIKEQDLESALRDWLRLRQPKKKLLKLMMPMMAKAKRLEPMKKRLQTELKATKAETMLKEKMAKADVAAVIAVSAPRVMNVRNVEIALSVKNVPAAW